MLQRQLEEGLWADQLHCICTVFALCDEEDFLGLPQPAVQLTVDQWDEEKGNWKRGEDRGLRESTGRKWQSVDCRPGVWKTTKDSDTLESACIYKEHTIILQRPFVLAFCLFFSFSKCSVLFRHSLHTLSLVGALKWFFSRKFKNDLTLSSSHAVANHFPFIQSYAPWTPNAGQRVNQLCPRPPPPTHILLYPCSSCNCQW